MVEHAVHGSSAKYRTVILKTPTLVAATYDRLTVDALAAQPLRAAPPICSILFALLGSKKSILSGGRHPRRTFMPERKRPGDHAPEFKHVDDMEWEMGRFKNRTKFLFHPHPDRPTEPNAGLLRYDPGASFPLHRHDFAQVWYILEGEFCCGSTTYGPGTFVYMPDPHFEHEMTTQSGGTVVFLQYPGPTTGARPIYDGRMNLTKPECPEEYDLTR
jgi:quercetin dioxygenase-like cupin family protein